MDWHERSFAQLTTRELYAIIGLRERVFVVEQRCIYVDADGLDPIATHVWAARAGEIAAYLRILPPGARYPEASIGRVIVAASERGTGLGRELVTRGINVANGAIRIGAQAHLQRFYGELGFETISELYDEDGIPHVDMIRRAGS
jgi:ElaA protein